MLREPPPDWTGERGYLTRDMLQRHLPDNCRELEYFLCGPKPMTDSVERSLAVMNVPLRHIHTELFDMA